MIARLPLTCLCCCLCCSLTPAPLRPPAAFPVPASSQGGDLTVTSAGLGHGCEFTATFALVAGGGPSHRGGSLDESRGGHGGGGGGGGRDAGCRVSSADSQQSSLSLAGAVASSSGHTRYAPASASASGNLSVYGSFAVLAASAPESHHFNLAPAPPMFDPSVHLDSVHGAS